ncbi:MAG: hypothetical protein H6605_02525 [Flavobacteriales bacterium]|nr:hypothetical protein [Flavobacteriales bacterium]
MRCFFYVLFFAFLIGCKPGVKENYSNSESRFIQSVSINHPGMFRFSITGDFNGDGEPDTIFESFISGLTGKEIPKIADSLDYENNLDLIMNEKPITRIYSSIKGIDTFTITKEPQQSGLQYFRNLGDLNQDGSDEIGLAIHWEDYSNLNQYFIYTIKKEAFVELFSFKIHESLFYDTSENLFSNGSFIQKSGPAGIQYIFYSDSATFETGKYKFNKQ